MLVVEHPAHVPALFHLHVYIIMHRQGRIQEFGEGGGGGSDMKKK